MKKISVVVPCYNEEENIKPICAAILEQLQNLSNYDYELIFIDNCSQDKTRELIKKICQENKKIKAIFNIRNFGQFNSPFYGLQQATGDCAILIAADFQDPIELIPEFIKNWEEGYKIVCGIKTSSKENFIIYSLRTIYYKMIKKFSNIEQIEHFTGFGLYDKTFLNTLRNLNDSTPFLRGIVAELGGKRKEIPYEQTERKFGLTHNNWYSLYDAAMLSFTSYTKAGIRLAIFAGVFFSICNLTCGLIYLILKLLYWDQFIAGQAPTIIILSTMTSLLLAFMGFLGEYIAAINIRLMNRPLVIEEERINFNQ